MANRTGQQLGNYRLVRFLGQGSFADVYLGEHVYLKSYAALKVLHRTLKEEDVERFLSEAQTLVQLRHAHIVRVLEFIFEQNIPVLVMDYAPGGTARQRYPTGSCLPLATTVAYVRQVAAALQYAHNHSIIHRDVKPDNILFDSEQQILLGDFGLALFAPSPEQLSTQEWVGTIPYMAPEQLQGKPTFASDQYALGIVTYEWLCGVRPFEGDRWALLHQHLFVAPPPLREKCPGVPASVEGVVLRALAKDPQQRFPRIQAFVLALERASRGNVLDVDSDSETTAALIPISPPSLDMPTTHTDYGLQAQHRVFLTAAPADEAFAARLQADLQARGIIVSRASEVSTLNQSNELRYVISDVQMMLVVVSPDTRSSRTIKEQLRLAGMYQQRLVFVRARGDDIAAVLPEAWGRTALIDLVDARGTRYTAALAEIIAFLQEATPAASLEGSTLPMLLEEPRNPYKGLRAFTRDDAVDFFGRDGLIEELAESIEGFLTAEKPTVPASRLLTVIGPSGSGKSSVVMAGLLPGLQQGALAGSQEWVYLDPIVPGKRPLEALILAFASNLPERSLHSIREDLNDDSARGLHLLATQLVKRPGTKAVLMIDQFEELFTQTPSEQERQRFIDLLVTAVTEPRGPLIVLLTLRADFYDRPMHYPHLSQLIEAHQKSVLPLNPHELRAVIEQPAALPDVQLLFEDDLVGDLLFEAQGQVGALPLLEFTLDQLFQLREDQWLTRKAYRQLGGVKGALAKHAESTYASLPSEEHRQLVRALFLRLVEPGATEQDTTRRRAALSELSLPDPQQAAIIREVADAFVTARLLTINEVAGTTTIEVSHEALIREWSRLAGWLHEAREDIILQQALSEDVAEWEQRKHPRGRLYRGAQLKEAQAWARRNNPDMQEVAFLRASAAQRIRGLMGVIVGILLLLTSTGVAALLYLTRPPDPTLVTTLQDNVNGSLRYCVANANSGSTIRFAQGLRGTIELTGGGLVFAGGKRLTIAGPGANLLTISGGTSNAYIHLSKGATVNISSLSFKNSETVIHAFLFNEGTLKLTSSIISDNKTTSGGISYGGGIENRGTLTVTHSTISNNSASGEDIGEGGGIFNYGTLTVINSILSGNKAVGSNSGGYGGGIFNFNPSILTVINSTLSENTAGSGSSSYGQGGGIDNDGTLTVTNSTLSNNSASRAGGGIFNYETGTLRVTNSTFLNNKASGKQASYGGGIVISGTGISAIIRFCTIYGNTSSTGGGIWIDPTGSSYLTISSSIVAANRAPDGPDISGVLISGGYNLIENVAGAKGLNARTDRQVTLADLKIDSTLRDNGGLTQTLALLQGSPAIDAVPAEACRITVTDVSGHTVTITTDQRGEPRPDGSENACDIGAYESSY